jgi:hypothetical protein
VSNSTLLHGDKWSPIRNLVLVFFLLGFSGAASSRDASSLLLIDFGDMDCKSEPPFEATLLWDLGDQFDGQIQLRIDSASGNLFVASDDSAGEARTGKWVFPGTKFLLLNQEDGTVLNELVVEAPSCDEQLVSESTMPESPSPAPVARAPARPATPPPPPRPEDLARTELDDRAILNLSPPRLRYCGLPVESASVRVHWDVADLGVDQARIYVNSLDGQLFADGGASGERITGDWVTNGMRFLLYLPELERVVAESEFRILPCNVVDYPDETGDKPDGEGSH